MTQLSRAGLFLACLFYPPIYDQNHRLIFLIQALGFFLPHICVRSITSSACDREDSGDCKNKEFIERRDKKNISEELK